MANENSYTARIMEIEHDLRNGIWIFHRWRREAEKAQHEAVQAWGRIDNAVEKFHQLIHDVLPIGQSCKDFQEAIQHHHFELEDKLHGSSFRSKEQVNSPKNYHWRISLIIDLKLPKITLHFLLKDIILGTLKRIVLKVWTRLPVWYQAKNTTLQLQ